MTASARAVVELVLACVAAAGSAWSWCNVRSVIEVSPITDGEPSTTSVVYDPPMLALCLLLATVAGVLAVVGVARWRRGRGAKHLS